MGHGDVVVVDPVTDHVVVVGGDRTDLRHVAREILKDEDHVEVLTLECDPLEMDVLDVAQGEDEGGDLGEVHEAIHTGLDDDHLAVRAPGKGTKGKEWMKCGARHSAKCAKYV